MAYFVEVGSKEKLWTLSNRLQCGLLHQTGRGTEMS